MQTKLAMAAMARIQRSLEMLLSFCRCKPILELLFGETWRNAHQPVDIPSSDPYIVEMI